MAGASAVDSFIIHHTSLWKHDHAGVISSMPHYRSLWLSIMKFSCLVITWNIVVFPFAQLATHKNAVGVAAGATIGHTICTSVAVVGGSMLASKISQRSVATVGGLLFMGFSLSSYFYPPLWQWKFCRSFTVNGNTLAYCSSCFEEI